MEAAKQLRHRAHARSALRTPRTWRRAEDDSSPATRCSRPIRTGSTSAPRCSRSRSRRAFRRCFLRRSGSSTAGSCHTAPTTTRKGLQAARLVAKILRGTRPADLPVEGADRVYLTVNRQDRGPLRLDRAAQDPAARGQHPAMSAARPQGRLFRKYVVVLVALVGGVLIASGVVELYLAYQETKRAVVSVEREKAVAAAERIEQFIKEIERHIRGTTHARRRGRPAPVDIREGTSPCGTARARFSAAPAQRAGDHGVEPSRRRGQGAAARLPVCARCDRQRRGFLRDARIPGREVRQDRTSARCTSATSPSRT